MEVEVRGVVDVVEVAVVEDVVLVESVRVEL